MVVDDTTHEAVAVRERAIGGGLLTRMLNRLWFERGLLCGIHTDNGKEFCSGARNTTANGPRNLLGASPQQLMPGSPSRQTRCDQLPDSNPNLYAKIGDIARAGGV